jgi:hypothetical protein
MNSSDTPRWVIVVGFVLTSLFGAGISLVTDGHKRQAENRVQQVRALIDTMTQFPVHATAFRIELTEKKTVTHEVRKALEQNIAEQFSRLKAVEPFIPTGRIGDVGRYKAALVQMQETVARTDDLENMGKFWTDASSLLIARNRLSEALRDSI